MINSQSTGKDFRQVHFDQRSRQDSVEYNRVANVLSKNDSNAFGGLKSSTDGTSMVNLNSFQ